MDWLDAYHFNLSGTITSLVGSFKGSVKVQNEGGVHLFENPAQEMEEDTHEYGQRPPYKKWWLAEKAAVKQLKEQVRQLKDQGAGSSSQPEEKVTDEARQKQLAYHTLYFFQVLS